MSLTPWGTTLLFIIYFQPSANFSIYSPIRNINLYETFNHIKFTGQNERKGGEKSKRFHKIWEKKCWRVWWHWCRGWLWEHESLQTLWKKAHFKLFKIWLDNHSDFPADSLRAFGHFKINPMFLQSSMLNSSIVYIFQYVNSDWLYYFCRALLPSLMMIYHEKFYWKSEIF